jgi:putative transposase
MKFSRRARRRPSSETLRVPTVTYRLLFVLVLLAHDRRRIVHLAVTAHPGASWTAQQLREACPWNATPRYLIHDRDHAFDGLDTTAKAMGIHDVLTAPGSPWQNSYVERFIGSVRRECLDHMLVFNESGLRRVLEAYRHYYERSRTHLALARLHVRSCATASWSPSQKLAASTTAMNVGPPEDPCAVHDLPY